MQRRRFVQQLAAFGLGTSPLLASASAAPAVSDATQQLASRVLDHADALARPFAVVDKHAATIAVYAAGGALAGLSRALLGRTAGDHSVPGVGERTQSGTLRPDDCTTPAGRFESTPGRNRDGEAIVWLDYRAALAIHRLRPGVSHAERARRLASAGSADKRVSAGCVVVPAAFYDGVVAAVLGRGPGVVYILPEVPPPDVAWRALWRDLSARAAA